MSDLEASSILASGSSWARLVIGSCLCFQTLVGPDA